MWPLTLQFFILTKFCLTKLMCSLHFTLLSHEPGSPISIRTDQRRGWHKSIGVQIIVMNVCWAKNWNNVWQIDSIGGGLLLRPHLEES